MSKPNIYDQHRAAFPSVSAYVITRDGKRVGTLAIKFPRDGASRLWCYLHVFGMPMVRGFADGGGYDKRTAAAQHAASKIELPEGDDWAADRATAQDVMAAMHKAEGWGWQRALEEAGFTVWQAV